MWSVQVQKEEASSAFFKVSQTHTQELLSMKNKNCPHPQQLHINIIV